MLTFCFPKLGQYLCLSLLSVLAFRTAAQTVPTAPKVIPPAPNVAALGKYGDIPVGTYNGLPNIDIPLYTIVSRHLSVPLSLSYHASGIKVSEEASRVGLGWVLNSGGLISRTVMGEDDFKDSPSTDYFHMPALPLGGFNQPYASNIQPGCNVRFAQGNSVVFTLADQYGQDATAYDFQPDQFSYSFAGQSGKFILDRNKQPILAKQEKLSLQCLDNLANAWEVKTADGTTYRFDQYETYTDNSGGAVHKSAWHLTKIKALTGEEITFNYQTVAATDVKTVGSFSERRYETQVGASETGCGSWNGEVGGEGGGNALPGYQYGTVSGRTYTTVYLSSIDYLNGQVKFVYDTREDLEGDKKLTRVQVFNKLASGSLEGSPTKEFVLGYDYFVGTNDQSYFPSVNNIFYITKRLKLLSVTEQVTLNSVTAAKNPYLFNYYESGVLPAKTSFARDHWGYYNGKAGRTTLIPSHQALVGNPDPVSSAIGLMGYERNTNPDYINYFSLKEITYPTKGRTEFQYEAHDYDPDLSDDHDLSYFGTRGALTQQLSKTKFYNGNNRGVVYVDTLDLTNLYVDKDGHYANTELSAAFRFGVRCGDIGGNPDVYFELYYPNGVRYSRVDLGLTQCNSSGQTNCIYCDAGTNSQSPVFTYRASLILPPGKYVWKAFAQTAAMSSSLLSFQDISATYNYIGVPPILKFGYAGGLRVSRMIDHDDFNEANNKVKRFVYRYQADKNNDGTPETYSYGKLMAMPQYSYFEKQQHLESSPTQSYTCTRYLLVRSSDSSIPLNGSAGGSVVGYSQVTVLNGDNGEYGSTVYQYENESDQVFNYSSQENIMPSSSMYVVLPNRPPAVSTLSNELNGQLKNQTDFDQAGRKVKELIHSYSNTSNQASLYYGLEKRLRNFSMQANCSPQMYVYPVLQTNWIHPSATTEKVYDQLDATKFTSVTTTYTYETTPVHYQVKSTSRASRTTEYTYPADYTAVNSGALALMKGSQHWHSAVVETVQKVQGQVVGGTFTTYQDVDGNAGDANAFLQPTSIATLKLMAPKASITSSLATGTAADPSYESRYVLRYDPVTASLREIQPLANISTSYLWSHRAELPIAEVKNATVDRIAFTSFEFGTGEGNWAYTKVPVGGTAGNYGKTGKQYYTITSASDNLSRYLPAGNYRLTYWAKGSAISVTGGTVTNLATSAADANGWVLYEQKVVLTATTLLTLSGNGGSLDEVRVHPLDAQMTTYTYDSLAGTSSTTDAANVTTYYEYDELQRLKRVKDQDSNILKHYIYHYKGQ